MAVDDETSYSILELADDAVHRGEVDFPTWFDIKLLQNGWPAAIVLSVVVDPDQGPLLSGIRWDRGYVGTHLEALDLFKTLDTAYTLQVVAALASGKLATSRALDPIRDKIEINDETLAQVRKLRDAFAARAYPSAVPQRRRFLTRDHLSRVTEVYRAAHSEGRPPTAAVAEHFQTSHSTATRWVGQARKAGLLGPAQGTRSGEAEPPTPSE